MKRSRRWNTLQICPRRSSNSGGSDLWSNALPVRPRRLAWDTFRLHWHVNDNLRNLAKRLVFTWVVSLHIEDVIKIDGWREKRNENTDLSDQSIREYLVLILRCCTSLGFTTDSYIYKQLPVMVGGPWYLARFKPIRNLAAEMITDLRVPSHRHTGNTGIAS